MLPFSGFPEFLKVSSLSLFMASWTYTLAFLAVYHQADTMPFVAPEHLPAYRAW
ncbi:MAG: hypothetical protein V2A77_04500 [Pseudomonadota bacterium]